MYASAAKIPARVPSQSLAVAPRVKWTGIPTSRYAAEKTIATINGGGANETTTSAKGRICKPHRSPKQPRYRCGEFQCPVTRGYRALRIAAEPRAKTPGDRQTG